MTNPEPRELPKSTHPELVPYAALAWTEPKLSTANGSVEQPPTDRPYRRTRTAEHVVNDDGVSCRVGITAIETRNVLGQLVAAELDTLVHLADPSETDIAAGIIAHMAIGAYDVKVELIPRIPDTVPPGQACLAVRNGFASIPELARLAGMTLVHEVKPADDIFPGFSPEALLELLDDLRYTNQTRGNSSVYHKSYNPPVNAR